MLYYKKGQGRYRLSAAEGKGEARLQQLLQDLKSGRFKQVYLLYGEEAYLRLQYRDRLKEALLGGDDSMNFGRFEGKDVEVGQIIDQAETLPFFADRRVILVENSGLFKKASDQLAEYVKEIPATTYLIFAETEVDRRGKLFKAVRDVGRAVEFPVQDEATLKKWILVRFRREGKQISAAALDHFLQKTGTDMENICREMEKLFCYTLGKDVVTEADMDAVCTRQVSSQIFDMVEAVAGHRRQQALKLYYDLLSLKEPPMRILFLIGRQFHLLLQVKELKKKGYQDREIGEKTGLKEFLVRKYASQAARFSAGELKESLTLCVEADEAIKTGAMSDRLSVELLLIRCSGETTAKS